MPSRIWNLNPLEAFERSYEYDVQNQFLREAESMLTSFYGLLNSDRNRFTVSDRSCEKAIWLLHMEALDSLRESLDALKSKRHRVASSLFRTVEELLALAAFFSSQSDSSASKLKEWYEDAIIPHSVYRKWLGTEGGEEAEELERDRYVGLSRLTHRSYRSILHGYSVGAEDRLVHDGTGQLYGNHAEAGTFLVLQQTLSLYYAILASLILKLIDESSRLGTSTPEDASEVMKASLEADTIEWRFTTPREVYERHLKSIKKVVDDEHGDSN